MVLDWCIGSFHWITYERDINFRISVTRVAKNEYHLFYWLQPNHFVSAHFESGFVPDLFYDWKSLQKFQVIVHFSNFPMNSLSFLRFIFTLCYSQLMREYRSYIHELFETILLSIRIRNNCLHASMSSGNNKCYKMFTHIKWQVIINYWPFR